MTMTMTRTTTSILLGAALLLMASQTTPCDAFYMHRVPYSYFRTSDELAPPQPPLDSDGSHDVNVPQSNDNNQKKKHKKLNLDHLQFPVVVDEVLSLSQCERWLSHILKNAHAAAGPHQASDSDSHNSGNNNGEELFLVQRGVGADLLHAKMPLKEGIHEVLEKSTHHDPIRVTSISDANEAEAQGGEGRKWNQELPVNEIFDQVFGGTVDTVTSSLEEDDSDKKKTNQEEEDDKDARAQEQQELNWFACLEKHLPLQDTLVVSGEGGTSSVLQCHPYTHLHLCIDGSQLIRLLPPLHWQDNPTLRNSAHAILQESWDGYPIALGYQASLQDNLNLFAHRHWDVDQLTRTLTQKDVQRSGGRNIYDSFQHWAEDPHKLHPNFAVGDMMVEDYRADTDDEDLINAIVNDGVNKDSHKEDDEDDQDDKDASNKKNRPDQKAHRLHHSLWHSTVALAGDLVVIPPGWWYQTYTVEPCVSIESQRCAGTHMAQQFIHHMLEETPGLDRQLLLEKPQGPHSKEEAQEIMDTLMELLEEHHDNVKELGITAAANRQSGGGAKSALSKSIKQQQQQVGTWDDAPTPTPPFGPYPPPFGPPFMPYEEQMQAHFYGQQQPPFGQGPPPPSGPQQQHPMFGPPGQGNPAFFGGQPPQTPFGQGPFGPYAPPLHGGHMNNQKDNQSDNKNKNGSGEKWVADGIPPQNGPSNPWNQYPSAPFHPQQQQPQQNQQFPFPGGPQGGQPWEYDPMSPFYYYGSDGSPLQQPPQHNNPAQNQQQQQQQQPGQFWGPDMNAPQHAYYHSPPYYNDGGFRNQSHTNWRHGHDDNRHDGGNGSGGNGPNPWNWEGTY